MLNYFDYPFGRAENIRGSALLATYLVYGADYSNILKKCGGFAVGQTVGTWVEVPGVTAEMVEKYQARVVSLEAAEAGGDESETVFVLRVAFPMANFGGSFTQLLTALVGNDVSTALRVKLVNLELCGDEKLPFAGAKKGIAELRGLTGAYDRPLVLNMIKPCLGFSPDEGAKLFYEVASGGVDMIKDDELLGSPFYSEVGKRAAAYEKAAESAYEVTGKRTLYLPNISGSPKQARENAKAALDAGARACLYNFIFGGLDTLAELCEEFGDRLFIMGHYAGVAALNWRGGGIANSVLLGFLPRLAGAHAVMTMYPNHSDSYAMYDFYKTVQAQTMPLADFKPMAATVGGGITPINQAAVQGELGSDCILGIGGAIQGHPMGTKTGAQTAMAAVEAAAKGIPLEAAAEECEGLREALRIWG